MNTTAERRYRLLVLGCLAHAAFVAVDYFFNSFPLGLIPRSLLRLYYIEDMVQHSEMPRSLLRGLFTVSASSNAGGQ